MVEGDRECSNVPKDITLFTNKPVKLESNPMDENNPANMVKPITPTDMTLIEDLFVIPDGNEYLLYAPFAKSVLSVNQSAIQTLRDLKKGKRDYLDFESPFFKELIQAGVLIATDSPKKSFQFQEKHPDFDPTGMTLFLTTKCSMRCTYCYADSGGDKPKLMPWMTAQAAMDWIIQHVTAKGRNKLEIGFHGGGEVTTAKPLLKKSVDFIRQQATAQGITTTVGAGLNGVMDRSMVDWVIDNIDSAALSFDGLPEVQNAQRPLSNGKGSYEVVAATLRRMDEKEFKYLIRITVTSQSLEKLVESVEFIAKNFNAKVIQIEPVSQVGRALNNNVSPVEPQTFVEKFREAQQVARSHGKELRYSGARFHTLTNHFCGVSDDLFAVTPDGLVTACYEVGEIEDPRAPLFVYGRLDPQSGQFEFDQEKIRKLRSLSVEHKPHCQNCFCKWHCAGECAAKLAQQGDAWDTSNNPRCYINRELTKDQMKAYLLQGGK
jgi:uncharacterized protein